MLWKKESNNGNANYVDLFKPKLGELNKKYDSISKERIEFRASGKYYKNDVTAVTFRKKGSEYFASNQFLDAMEWYNKSLCFAENGSETLGLAYANRTRCFLSMKMFKKCLADIELAKQNKYPSDIVLNALENKCLKLMETEEDQGEIGGPKLDFEPNEKLPCLANVLEIANHFGYGRHIAATENIGVGKTVIVEQCYIGVTQFDLYKSCNICLKEKQNFIPCKKCPTALFCFDCNGKNLHTIECDMHFGCPPGFELMAVVRSISLAKNAFASADELVAFVEDMLKSDESELPSNLVDGRAKYRAFFKSCFSWMPCEINLDRAYTFYRLLLEQESMRTFFHSQAHKRFLMHLVLHHISMIIEGSYNKRTSPFGRDTYINIIAKHINRTCSFIPNVRLVFEGGYTICSVIQPLKKKQLLMLDLTQYNNF